MYIFRRYITLLFVLISSNIFSAETLKVLTKEPGLLVLELHIDSIFVDEKNNIQTNPSIHHQSTSGLPNIPIIKEVLMGVPSNASVDIFQESEHEINDVSLVLNSDESAKGIDYSITTDQWSGNLYPINIAGLSQSDLIRGHETSILSLFPLQYHNGSIFWWGEITIQITWQPSHNTIIPTLLSQKSLKNIDHKIPVYQYRTNNVIPAYQFSDNIAKITVDSTGWYAMTKESLVDSGLSLQNIDPRTLQLWNKEDEIPLLVEGEEDGVFNSNDKIIFYGKRLPSPEGSPYPYNFYSNDNVYWLTWGESTGRRFIIEGAYPSEDLPSHQKPVFFREAKYIEENEYFSRLGQMGGMQHHRWDEFDHFFMNPPIYSGTSTDYPLDINFPASSNFSINFEFQGITTGIHRLQIQINGHLIGETEIWEGQSAHQFSIEVFEQENIPLNNGENTLTVINLEEDSDEHYDMTYLNWLNISYDRFFTTNNDSLVISTAENWVENNIEYSCSGFTHSDIYIFKDEFSYLTDYLIIEDLQNNEFNVIFQDIAAQNTNQYHIFSSDKLNSVKSVTPKEPILSLLNTLSNEYIAICPDSFNIILDPLVVQHHNGSIINIDDIYRQYSFGILSPYAIKDFLQDIYFTNDRALRHVLIALQGGKIGFYSIVWYGNIENFIPSMKIQTIGWGAASSDYWYSCVEGDDFYGDFAIGRFPAKDKNELSVHVDKTLRMLNNDDEYWHNQMLMIAGYEETFKDQSESLIEPMVQNSFFPFRLYIDVTSETGPFFGGTPTLIEYLDKGQTYINFFGHGGGAVWGDRSILTLEALPFLTNTEKLPFITSMTCFTGDVTNPNGLGRKMLALEEGGAVGWFGSSGVGWVINDYLLLQPIMDRLVSAEDMTIGEILLEGKIEYAATNLYYPHHSITQLYQFNYSGDPAFKIPKPSTSQYEISIADPEPGETIDITINPTQEDSVYYQVFDENNLPLNFSPSYLIGNSTISYTINDSVSSGNYRMNAASKSEDDLYHTTIPFTVSGSFLEITEIIPNEPTYSDSIQIIGTARDRQGISSVQLYINNNYFADLINTGNDLYQLPNAIPPLSYGNVLRLQLLGVDSQGMSTNSSVTTLHISYPPDFLPQDLAFTVSDSIGLKSRIRNVISTPGDVEVGFEKSDGNNQWISLGKDTLHFTGLQALDAAVFNTFDEGTHLYRVISNSLESNSNAYNDTLTRPLTTNAFMVSNGSEVGVDGVDCMISSGTGIIELESYSDVSTLYQSDFTHYQADSLRNALQIITSTDISYTIQWHTRQDTVVRNLYKYYENVEIWLPFECTLTDTSVIFNSIGDGIFTFMLSDDIESPYTEATVNAQRFLNNSYVNTTPDVYISAIDDNGLDFRKSSVKCWTSLGDSIQIENINGVGNTLGLQFKPNLSVLDSVLYFLIKDASGNVSDTLDLHFIVRDELDLIDYGNFPNPFANQTRFTYELTESVDLFYLDIYTVSGRRIRRLNSASTLTDLDPNLGGFHEIVWDGRNDNGDYVANGVYFYKITVKKGKTVIDRIGKAVKAR